MLPTFVLDNSVTMGWAFADEENAYSNAVRSSLSTAKAVVPAIWPLEVGNALLVAERAKRVDGAERIRFLEMLAGLRIEVQQESPKRMLGEILSLANKYKLSTYDASYLDLAMRLAVPIAAEDKKLFNAAVACGVPIYLPDPGHKWE